MPNRNHNKQFGGKSDASPPAKKAGGSHLGTDPKKTANWPGPPGQTQSKDRSSGVKKLKQFKTEGL